MPGAVTSTYGLIERARAGDQEAFAELFHSYRRRLAVLVHYQLSPALRGTLEIDDILQETFLRAFRDLRSFRYESPGSFMRWLARVAQHVIVDTARYHGRRQRQAGEQVPLRDAGDSGGPEPADSRTPSRLLREAEGLRALLVQFDALPPDYREVILLSKVEGLSTAEVAERLGRTRQATAVLLHRAVKRLREVRERLPQT